VTTPEFPFLEDHAEVQRVRYEKVAAMRENNQNPYPAQFQAKDLAADVLTREDELIDQADKSVTLMGRVINVRLFGKAAFFHILDRTGKIQAYISKKEISEDEFTTFKKYMDNGDIVGITGMLFKTKTGETTVMVSEFHLLTKSTRPLPEKWGGLKDVEIRYRQRYADLIMNEEVMKTFQTRSKMIGAMRSWLNEQDFLEVETPMMQALYGGASARPFITHHNTLDMDLYMRIAPELYLKRLVVGGMHRVYEINRNFRNEGISVQHNPEFTMLELYAAGWDCTDMMDFVELIIGETIRLATGTSVVTIGDKEVDLGKRPWPRLSIIDALNKYCNVEMNWDMDLAAVKSAAGDLHIPDEIKTGLDAIIHLFEENVEEHLIEPTYITEFPKAVSPLAKAKDDDPNVTDRFELYINKMELANGFSELNDPAEQYARFAEQVERKKAGDPEAVGLIDEDYVRALEYGLPPTAGLGIGIDRLVMIATNSASIRDVILFPLMKPKKEVSEEESESEASE